MKKASYMLCYLTQKIGIRLNNEKMLNQQNFIN